MLPGSHFPKQPPIMNKQQLNDGSWGPSIPIPFWIRSWRTLFRYVPACYECSIRTKRQGKKPVTFKTEEEYGHHYLAKHYIVAD